MKVFELIEALEQYEEDADVVISIRLPRVSYHAFTVNEYDNMSFDKDGLSIVALELGDEIKRPVFMGED